jgi:nucleotide-binding universal stress UspA family protein
MAAQTTSAQFVVGLDADGRADAALSAALELAERLGSRVHGVHAIPLAPALWAAAEGAPVTPVLGADVLEAARARSLARLAARMRPFQGTPLDVVVRFGHPAQVVLDEARARDAGLVFLGPHRRRGIVDLGSTARAVLAKAPGAVWVQVEEPRPLRTILAAVDLSPQSLLALATARDLAAKLGARLVALHVFQPPDVALLGAEEAALPALWDVGALRASARTELERAVGAFDWRGIAHEHVLAEGDPAQEVLARQETADLVVLGTHGRTALAAFLLGSVAHSVLRAARRPVLAIRHAERPLF